MKDEITSNDNKIESYRTFTVEISEDRTVRISLNDTEIFSAVKPKGRVDAGDPKKREEIRASKTNYLVVLRAALLPFIHQPIYFSVNEFSSCLLSRREELWTYMAELELNIIETTPRSRFEKGKGQGRKLHMFSVNDAMKLLITEYFEYGFNLDKLEP